MLQIKYRMIYNIILMCRALGIIDTSYLGRICWLTSVEYHSNFGRFSYYNCLYFFGHSYKLFKPIAIASERYLMIDCTQSEML
jgi:hypothetical protein